MEHMDRIIDPTTRRRRQLRRLVLPAVAAAIGLILIVLATGWLRPSVRRDRVRTAHVEQGEVTATLDASGLVVPEFEHVLGPMSTRIAKILKTPGTEVAPGEPIVLLDDRDARHDVARLEEQITLKENSRSQAKLETGPHAKRSGHPAPDQGPGG